MLIEAVALTLQLPPLAFNQTLPTPPLRPPRELVCPVRELGRPWQPSAPRPFWTAGLPSLDPRNLRPRDREPLVNPLADIVLFFALAGWVSQAGGSVDLRPWSERTQIFQVPPPALPGPAGAVAARPRF